MNSEQVNLVVLTRCAAKEAMADRQEIIFSKDSGIAEFPLALNRCSPAASLERQCLTSRYKNQLLV
eukprot:CCRYP_016157-RA/>CCRYP_016157-RA protein AED:0.35 eAED:0.35 QI:1144/0.33/0.5/1/0/0/4/0/65